MIDGKVSVVIPAYNEAHHIVHNMRETVEALSAMAAEYEIIVVDDGSPDHTWLRAAQVLDDFGGNVHIIRYDRNRGKGNALICGAYHATGEYVVFLDADMDLHPSQLPTFFGILEAQQADVVIGSKLHPASNVNYPFVRRLWSLAYYAFIRLLFGLPVRDTQTGLKVFKAEVVRRVFPKVLVKRFAFDLEVLALAHDLGYRIAEAPVTLIFQRRFGRVKLRDVFNIFWDTLAVFYRLRLLHYYDTVGSERPATDGALKVLTGTRSR